MIAADRDGVVVVPFDQIEETIENLERVKHAEAIRDQAVANGMKIPTDIVQLLKSNRTKFSK